MADKDGSELHELRQRAEQIIANSAGPLPEQGVQDLEGLLHEIGVRQVELELQNEELKRAQSDLENSLDRYRELYDFAPVGYLTIHKDERIAKANFQAADFLGRPRSEIQGRYLSHFVEAEDLRAFRSCLQEVQESGTPTSREIRFRADRHEGRILHTEMTVNLGDHGISPEAEVFRLSLTDISAAKEVETELREARAQLERRVNERTTELRTANESLKKEIHARQEIEAKLRKNQLRLRSLAAEVTNTEERQRRELARTLHDLVAQTLAIAKMKLSAAEKYMESTSGTEALRETKDLVQEMIESTRSIMTELSPPVFEEQDVATAVQWLVDHVNEKFDLCATAEISDPELELQDDARRFLYRSLQELLVNVVRHANTQDAEVRLEGKQDGVVLTVSDNGRGFNVGDVRSTPGFGIFSIQQRVEDLGGSFSVDSTPGRGTTATLTIPTWGSD